MAVRYTSVMLIAARGWMSVSKWSAVSRLEGRISWKLPCDAGQFTEWPVHGLTGLLDITRPEPLRRRKT